MKAVLLGVAVLLIQIFVVGCYYTFLAILAPRSAMRVWLASSVLLVLLAFVLIKSQCHECLTVPSVAQCQRSQAVVPAIDIELHSTRIGGYIVKRHFLGCDFYWHENDSEAGRSPSAKPGSAPSRYGLGGLRRRAGWSQRVGHNNDLHPHIDVSVSRRDTPIGPWAKPFGLVVDDEANYLCNSETFRKL